MACRLSICVPTYNRPECLPRLIESLGRQSFPDFEVVFVDDGSRSPIEPILAEETRAYPRLSWRCIRVPNGGRARALNHAFDLCEGELVMVFDDDDTMPRDALEGLWGAWAAIPALERQLYCGVVGLCLDQDGEVIGDRLPEDKVVDYQTLRYRLGVKGDKKEAIRRDLVTHFRFRVFPDEKRCPTTAMLLWLSQSLAIKTVNVACAVKEYRGDGLSRNIVKARVASSRTTEEFYRQALGVATNVTFTWRIRWAANLIRFRAHSLLSRPAELRRRTANLIAVMVGMPIGIGLLVWDYVKLRKRVARS